MIPKHSIAANIAAWPTDELSSGEFAQILGVGAGCISNACKAGLIETLAIHVRDKADRKHKRNTYRIPKSAALHYLWRNTSGDRTQLRAALHEICPHLFKVWETDEATAAAQQPLSANVVQMPRAKHSKIPQRQIPTPRPGDMVQQDLFAHA